MSSTTTYSYDKMDEMILCSPTEPLKPFIIGDSLISNQKTVEKILLHYANNAVSKRRGDAEEDFTLKQLIPYIVLVKGDTVFLYERLKGAGEKRLVGSSSVGIGGHMNLISNDPFGLLNNIYVDADRELNEELNLSRPIDVSRSQLFFLNDDSNEVGKVHLGAVLLINVEEDIEATVKETEQLAGRFVPFDEIDANLLENWSKIVLTALGYIKA